MIKVTYRKNRYQDLFSHTNRIAGWALDLGTSRPVPIRSQGLIGASSSGQWGGGGYLPYRPNKLSGLVFLLNNLGLRVDFVKSLPGTECFQLISGVRGAMYCRPTRRPQLPGLRVWVCVCMCVFDWRCGKSISRAWNLLTKRRWSPSSDRLRKTDEHKWGRIWTVDEVGWISSHQPFAFFPWSFVHTCPRASQIWSNAFNGFQSKTHILEALLMRFFPPYLTDPVVVLKGPGLEPWAECWREESMNEALVSRDEMKEEPIEDGHVEKQS